MKTSPAHQDDLRQSVLAVPPLARDADLTLNKEENRKLVRHLEGGGVTTLMYGGNANFYHVGLREYFELLEMLVDIAGEDSWVIPSVGPDYGRMMDQATVLRDFDFPTAMVLPPVFPFTEAGAATGIRHFAEALGRQIIVYIKSETYLQPGTVAQLVNEGLVLGIKYANVRQDPADDPYLERLVDQVERKYIISGIGERPAVVHLRDFGLNGFTSGSVCVAPGLSTRILRALQKENYSAAETLRQEFLPLEDLRDGISPMRVIHDAVSLAGIADMGPVLPLLSNLSEAERAQVAGPARTLLETERQKAEEPV